MVEPQQEYAGATPGDEHSHQEHSHGEHTHGKHSHQEHRHGEPSHGRDSEPRDDLHDELRARGYRLTPQRQLVLEAVEELGHATPETVLSAVRQKARGVNMSTIYRTLELLEELQLVSHAHLGHGAPTYHSTSGPRHAHLVCRSCGRVTEVPPEAIEPLAASLREAYAFVTDVRHLTVFGDCADCPDDESSAADTVTSEE
ncbi:MAG TPA: Fur family transcriptional regulator [Actinopolymorphaceae bacterium]|nr:Fur family transcriptional regulator [Actinopolymorphaceae bacterium]